MENIYVGGCSGGGDKRVMRLVDGGGARGTTDLKVCVLSDLAGVGIRYLTFQGTKPGDDLLVVCAWARLSV